MSLNEAKMESLKDKHNELDTPVAPMPTAVEEEVVEPSNPTSEDLTT